MSTLRYFFDIKNGEENRKLFDGLYISNSPLMSEQGKYPVIFITMKGIIGRDLEEVIKDIEVKSMNYTIDIFYRREIKSKC